MRIVIALAVLLIALVVAAVLRRHQGSSTPAGPRRTAPDHIHRADFPEVDLPWLLIVFTSATCSACADAVDVARRLGGTQVGVIESEFGADRARHERYAIDAVPTTLIADEAGEVRAVFFGPTAEAELRHALVEAGGSGVD